MLNTEFENTNRPRRDHLRRRLKRAVGGVLTPRQKAVVEAVYFRKCSQAEAARLLGVHRSTVNRTLHRAERKLKEHLMY